MLRLTNKNSETYPDGAFVGGSVLNGWGVLGVFGDVFGTLALGTYQEVCAPLPKQWGWGGDREACS